MKIKIVTSFNEKLWDRYAQKCVSSWVDNLWLDEGSEIEAWLNGPFPRNLPTKTTWGTPFKYKSLDTQSEGWTYFYEHWSRVEVPQDLPPHERFRFNFLPFSCKVFALAEAAWEAKESQRFDALCWLDADVMITKKLESQFLKDQLFGNTASLVWLDRGPKWGYGETGFILSSTKDNSLDIFLDQANMWGSGQLFYMREWHDAFTFSSLVKMRQFLDTTYLVIDLNKDRNSEQNSGLYPFETSVLKDYLVHYKGPLKEKLSNGNSS